MKEYFVISDTHSYYNPMVKALKDAGFDENNPEHIIICCGDIMDRGRDSKKVLDFFYKLFQEKRTILIRGNHEDLFDQMITEGMYNYYDITNGTLQTLEDLQVGPKKQYSIKYDFDEFINSYDKRWDVLKNSMLDYYEGNHYIFVHGWIPILEKVRNKFEYDKDWRTATKGEWANARWLNGMECAFQGVIEPGKTIVCGHWHAAYGNVRKKFPKSEGYTEQLQSDLEFSDDKFFETYYNDGIIAIDACTAHTGFVNCLHLTEDEL